MSRTPRGPLPLLLVATLVATLAAGCGFKLRGQLDLPVQTIRVQGDYVVANAVAVALERGSDVRVVRGEHDPAELVIKILGGQQERHVRSVGGAGRVRSFLLLYRLVWQPFAADGSTALAAPQTIELTRDMVFSDAELLAKEAEEALIFRDLQQQAATQMLRRLAAMARSAGTTPAPEPSGDRQRP